MWIKFFPLFLLLRLPYTPIFTASYFLSLSSFRAIISIEGCFCRNCHHIKCLFIITQAHAATIGAAVRARARAGLNSKNFLFLFTIEISYIVSSATNCSHSNETITWTHKPRCAHKTNHVDSFSRATLTSLLLSSPLSLYPIFYVFFFVCYVQHDSIYI